MISGFGKVAVIALFMALTGQVQAGTVDTLQQEYKAAGAGPFSAAKGQQMWTEKHRDVESGNEFSCQTCHGDDLKKSGKHEKTGKIIDPLAPSANKERLTDIKFINKWFLRNCKQVLGRECTPQEKGDFLEYLKGL